jgi:hypothetical protein
MARPHLTIPQVLEWAEFQHRCTRQWPISTSGPVLCARGDNWKSVDNAPRYGLRGLPGGSSLAQLLQQERGVQNRLDKPELAVSDILAWARAEYARTGAWPNMDSGTVAEASGETWHGINADLRDGCRGLPGGVTLAVLLASELGARNHTNIPDLTVPEILTWADAYHARTGLWPRPSSGPIPDCPGTTWHAVESALQHGLRGLAPGQSLYRLLKQHRGIPGPRPPVRVAKVPAKGRGRRRIRVELPAEVLYRCRAGELDAADVARLCRVSVPIARRELKRAGVVLRGRPGRPRGRRPFWHRDAVRLYRRAAIPCPGS